MMCEYWNKCESSNKCRSCEADVWQDCCDQYAAFHIEELEDNIETIISDHMATLRELEQYKKFFDDITNSHDCNDCSKTKICRYVPKWGELVRINCPLWGEVE